MLILFLKAFKYIFPHFISLNTWVRDRVAQRCFSARHFPSVVDVWLNMPHQRHPPLPIMPSVEQPTHHWSSATRHRLSDDRLSMFAQPPDTLKSKSTRTTLWLRSSGSSSIIPVQTLIGLDMPSSPPPNSWLGTPTRQRSIRACHVDSDTKTPPYIQILSMYLCSFLSIVLLIRFIARYRFWQRWFTTFTHHQ